MDTTARNLAESAEAFRNAKKDIAADMEARGIGAILWDNSTAGFHQLPEISYVSPETGKESTQRIDGLYLYDGEIYLMVEDHSPVTINNFYDSDSEVKPTVVTLTPAMADKALGTPDNDRGFTQQGSLEEWLVITDCYYEALCER